LDEWERHGGKKPKKKVKKSDTFIIDTREPASMHNLFEIFKVPIKLKTMQFGDYQLADAIAERKTIFDFTASFRNTRVFNQLEGLTREGECFPFLFVTGTLDKLKEDVHFAHVNEKTVIGAMGSCMCRYAVNVIWCRDDTSMVAIMTQLFKELKKYTPKDYDGNFMLLSGTTSDLSKMGDQRKEVIKVVAEIISEGVNIMWTYDHNVGLRVMSRMFHKINEGKRGQPRRRMIKKDAGGRTANLVRNYLRVEPALARSLVRAANKDGVGVMRYILETPNSTLLSHPGMGNVTLKRLRELVG